MTDASPAIVLRDVCKSFRVGWRRRRPGLDGLSLLVPRGEVFGYLGPNGAGKTTTIKLLLGLLRADRGRIEVLGVPSHERGWRFRIGYVPEVPSLYDYLTPREYLDYAGRLLGLDGPTRRQRAKALLGRLGLEAVADLPMRRFSKGMIQKVALSQALINDPELVILDEPLSGLDPIGRRLFRDIILEMRQARKTVFFSTHILPDAETLCDRVAVIQGGRLVQVGRLDEILRIAVERMEVLVTGLSQPALDQLPSAVVSRRAVGERLRLEIMERDLGQIICRVEGLGGRVLLAQPIRESLEEHFMRQVTGDRTEGGESWLCND